MARIILGLLVFLSAVSTATATLTPRKDELRLTMLAMVSLAERITKVAPPPQAQGFRITAATAIQLDGRPCRYEEVPAHATVILVELEPDGKTVIRVHFQTKK